LVYGVLAEDGRAVEEWKAAASRKTSIGDAQG
jgi:hypothetical protein